MLQQGRRVPRRPREWGSRALFIAVLFWIAGAFLFATRLSTLKHAPINSADAPELSIDSPIYIKSKNIISKNRRRLDTTNRAKSAPLPTSPPALALLHAPEERVSELASPLTPDTLKGGWQFNQQVYNHATKNLKENNATVISWESPRLVHFKTFLSSEEVDHLINIAESGFTRSEVVSDSEAISQSRTSYGAWMNGERRTETVYQIQDRIAQVTGIPEAFGESLYVLRYEQGQRYEMHTDHCRANSGKEEALPKSCRTFLKRSGGPGCGLDGGGQTCGDRLATFIIYLKSPERGGETVFPRAVLQNQSAALKSSEAADLAHAPVDSLIGVSADGTLGQAENGNGVEAAAHHGSEKANKHGSLDVDVAGAGKDPLFPWYCTKASEDKVLKVFPQPGDAIFFFNYIPGTPGETISDDLIIYNNALAVPDPTSAHSGCPPIEGTKMIATRWMRSSVFE